MKRHCHMTTSCSAVATWQPVIVFPDAVIVSEIKLGLYFCEEHKSSASLPEILQAAGAHSIKQETFHQLVQHHSALDHLPHWVASHENWTLAWTGGGLSEELRTRARSKTKGGGA